MTEHYYYLEDDGFLAMEVRNKVPRIGDTITAHGREWEVFYVEGKSGNGDSQTARLEPVIPLELLCQKVRGTA